MKSKQAAVKIGNRMVGDGHPVFIVAEIGINHNGSLELAKKLIDGASVAGCDAVKFQKRTPVECVPRDQWHIERDTPWGRMTYIDYRHKIELGEREYDEIDRYCKDKGMLWFGTSPRSRSWSGTTPLATRPRARRSPTTTCSAP
jgi:N-acetylneuraminate synthase